MHPPEGLPAYSCRRSRAGLAGGDVGHSGLRGMQGPLWLVAVLALTCQEGEGQPAHRNRAFGAVHVLEPKAADHEEEQM
jgi:hypothetical protein